MTNAPDKKSLIDLLQLVGELSEIGHTNVAESFEHLHRRMGRLFHSDFSHLIVHLVEPDLTYDPPSLLSPRIRTAMIRTMGTDADRRTRLGNDWAQSTPNPLDDPVVLENARQFGTHRTLTRSPMVDFDADIWRASAVPALFDAIGMHSRVVTTVPVDGRVEFSFGFDRPRGEDPFSERDRQLLHLLFASIHPLLRSFCQSKGYLPDQTELTPREQDVLEFLLGPHSEKEIADILGLSTSWLHEVVISIYRKFNVRSRPELMSKWL